MIGNIIYNGYIANLQIEEAISYYQKAITLEQKNGIGILQSKYAVEKLAALYYNKKDPQAIYWYEKAAEYGNIYAQNMLGFIYLDGSLTQKDIKKAYSYFINVFENTEATNEDKRSAAVNLRELFRETNDIQQADIWDKRTQQYSMQ